MKTQKKKRKIKDSERLDYLEWMTLTKVKFFSNSENLSLRQAIDREILKIESLPKKGKP